MGMQGKHMEKIIHGKDSTLDTWEGKDNTWDNTWKDFKMFLVNVYSQKLRNFFRIVCAQAGNKPPDTLFKPPDMGAQLQYK
jgi:hypothetical protein